MRIAIFTDTFYPSIDGVTTTIMDTTEALARNGHTILICAPKYHSSSDYKHHRNVEIFRLPSKSLPTYKNFRFVYPCYRKCLRKVMEFSPDIIHLETYSTLGLAATKIAKKMKLPLMGTFHTLFTDAKYLKHAFLNFWIARKLVLKYMKFLYGKCDMLTCPSESCKEELLKMKIHVPVKVVMNAVDLPKAKRKITPHLKMSKEKLLIFIGRVAHEKNIPYLLTCFHLVVDRLPDVKLAIIGDGPQMPSIRRLTSKLGLSEKVILVGAIRHEDLFSSRYMRMADLFVTASSTETQGISTLETQSFGIPCVAVDATGARDLVKNGYNGFLVKKDEPKAFADSVIRILSDPALHHQMSRNAIETGRRHDISHAVAQWEKTYHELIT